MGGGGEGGGGGDGGACGVQACHVGHESSRTCTQACIDAPHMAELTGGGLGQVVQARAAATVKTKGPQGSLAELIAVPHNVMFKTRSTGADRSHTYRTVALALSPKPQASPLAYTCGGREAVVIAERGARQRRLRVHAPAPHV